MKYKIKFTGKNFTAVLKFLMTHGGDGDDFLLVTIYHNIYGGWYFNFFKSHLNIKNGFVLSKGDILEFNPEKRCFKIHEIGEKKWW